MNNNNYINHIDIILTDLTNYINTYLHVIDLTGDTDDELIN